jgi:hypothetical protein
MPSPYSSIDASMEKSNETMEIQGLGDIRKEVPSAAIPSFTRSREKICEIS